MSPFSNLALPVIAAPMFIVSNPKLVIAQCKAGIVGSMPALNARPAELLDEWLHEIQEACPGLPYAINLIVHRSNERLEHDLAVCEKRKVPLVITSLGVREDVSQAVHGWGGLVLHDVIDNVFARKAVEKGADGLIAVAAGAGGHAGRWSPFALVQEIRAWFDGVVALSGCIATGRAILAARAMGADFAYIGTPFIATEEANAEDGYKQAIVAGGAADIVYSSLFTGVHGNYLRGSISAAGLDPDDLPLPESGVKISGAKAWKEIWGAGQGIGAITKVQKAGDYIAQLKAEYIAARAAISA